MRRYLIGMLVLGALGVWLSWPGTSRDAEAETGQAGVNFGFGLEVAGSYLVQFEQQDPLPRNPVPALATFNADGGMTATDVATMFGAGIREEVGFRSPIHGNWRRTGSDQLTFRLLAFAYDEAGALGTDNLAGGSMLRTTGTLTLENGSLSGSANLDIFMPGQDPLDPAEAPAFTVPLLITARRIDI